MKVACFVLSTAPFRSESLLRSRDVPLDGRVSRRSTLTTRKRMYAPGELPDCFPVTTRNGS